MMGRLSLAMLAVGLLCSPVHAVLLDASTSPFIVEINNLTETVLPSGGADIIYIGVSSGRVRVELLESLAGPVLSDSGPQAIDLEAERAGHGTGVPPNFPVSVSPSFRTFLRVTVLEGAIDLDSASLTVTINNPPTPGLPLTHYTRTVYLPRAMPDNITLFSRTIPARGVDTYVRGGAPNTNEGASEFLRISALGANRALIKYGQVPLANRRGDRGVASAVLQLIVVGNGNNWGRDGRAVDLHRLTADWQEGNGRSAEYDSAEALRGTMPGATWHCAVDNDIANFKADCSDETEWEMGRPGRPDLHPWLPNPTATALITNGLIGLVEFDVTEDMQAFATGTAPNYGWILKKRKEWLPGRVEFAARESADGPGESIHGPRLVIMYGP
jgi:hypothetical protein